MMNYKILQSSTGVTFRMLACVLIFFGVLTDGNTAPQKVSDQAHGLVAYHSVTKPPLAANEVQATVSGRVTDAVSGEPLVDRKSTRLNSSHVASSYAVFCLKKKKKLYLLLYTPD